MIRLFASPLRPGIAVALSAVAIGAAFYFRKSALRHDCRQSWNRLDRNASVNDLTNGSFPASDPPSSVPAA
ncbi:MAG: hypothetical protein ABJF23_24805 [Bryobacteraceae bacterium]